MTHKLWPMHKILALAGMVLLYITLAVVLKISAASGLIGKAPPAPVDIGGTDTLIESSPDAVIFNLEAARSFFQDNFVSDSGYVQLYISLSQNTSLGDNRTNSEAISYSLLIAAEAGDKKAFDKELDFVQAKMVHPKYGYLMWRLEPDGNTTEDGSNIATDADIRAIKALLIAEKKWNDVKYTKMIDQLAEGMEKMAITNDGMLAPYAGVSGETSVWKANEIWLSYSDFRVFKELSKRRHEPWTSLFRNMKRSVINAQIFNGLYNSMLTEKREYGNGIDGGGYSINSMWIMVRNAESDDPELRLSANKSLKFYKDKFQQDAELYAMYGSNGDSMSPSDTPWAYALVGRAAVALGDKEFSEKIIEKLIEHQITNVSSPLFGAFPEGHGNGKVVGQFTMQESILTLQEYARNNAQTN